LACIDPDAFVLVISDHGAKKLDGAICFNEWLIHNGYLKPVTCPEKATPISSKLIDWGAAPGLRRQA